MRNTELFIRFFYAAKRRDELKYLGKFLRREACSIDELEAEQLQSFHVMFDHAKRNVPYYDQLFSSLKLCRSDFNVLSDISKIPILEKKDILENYQDMMPRNDRGRYVTGATGGSTGEPLKYRMSLGDYSRGVALLYRGLGRGGYRLGDRVAVVAGGSLIKSELPFLKRVQNRVLNFDKYSSYGMGKEELQFVYDDIVRKKPRFLRGYASSIALFAGFCDKNRLPLSFDGVFSTAEMLSKGERSKIENVFETNVFDNYGLNDGGISAYEDTEHDGFLVDTERALLEIVPQNQLENRMESSGRIVATSLHNFAFPFIRYDTGDNGMQVLRSPSSSGRKMLINLLGRTTDYIEIGEKTVGSPVLTVLMGRVDVLKYQIIQRKGDVLEIRIDKGPSFDRKQEAFIENSLKSNLGDDVEIIFSYDGKFMNSQNKHKFIIKE